MQKSVLRTYLVWILPLLILVFLFQGYQNTRYLENEINQDIEAVGQVVTGNISSAMSVWLEDQIRVAQSIAADDRIVAACLDPTDQQAYDTARSHLENLHGVFTYYENIPVSSFTSGDRTIAVTYDGEQREVPPGAFFLDTVSGNTIGKGGDRNYIEAIRNGSSAFVSEVYPSILRGNPIFVISVPVKQGSQVVGAVIVAPQMDYFTNTFSTQEAFGETEYVFFGDTNGNVIAHPNKDLILTEEGVEALKPYLAQINQGNYEFTRKFGGTDNFYYVEEYGLDGIDHVSEWYVFYRRDLQPTQARLARLRNAVFLLNIAALVILSTIIVFLTRRLVTRPIGTVREQLEAIAAGGGDLTQSIQVSSKNEIGSVGAAFNQFVEALRNLIVRVKTSANDNKAVGDDLSAAVSQSFASIHEITANINSIKEMMDRLSQEVTEAASSTEEIQRNISQLSQQTEEQSSSVTESTAAVEEMVASLNNMAKITETRKTESDRLLDSVQQGASLLEETNQSMGEVSNGIDSIIEMTTIIQGIADQTNILSMNAAIEAAHAGEAGRGFAVVAEEIRKLAENSGESSKTIAANIKDIVTKIQTAGSSLQGLHENLSSSIGELRAIAEAFSELGNSTQEIAAGSNQVIKSMTVLENAASQISSAAKEMQTGSDEMTGNMSGVSQVSMSVKAAIDEIAAGSQEIMNAMSSLQELNTQLSDQNNQLVQQVSGFRTSNDEHAVTDKARDGAEGHDGTEGHNRKESRDGGT